MKPTRKLSRRSFLRRVGGGAIGAGSFLGLAGCATGPTDSDPYDPVGGGAGRGWGHGGYSDNDSGAYADPPGRGRGGQGGYSDNDTGRYADPRGTAAAAAEAATATMIAAATPIRPGGDAAKAAATMTAAATPTRAAAAATAAAAGAAIPTTTRAATPTPPGRDAARAEVTEADAARNKGRGA